MAYYREDPWGDQRADLRSAQIAQILWNANCKKDKARKLTEFLMFWKKPPAPEDTNIRESVMGVFGKLMSKK